MHSTRLQLSEAEAQAVHSALVEALTARLLPDAQIAAAHDVLERLTTRVPGWLDRTPIRGEAGFIAAADAVLNVLVDAEDDGRSSLSAIEIAHRLGAAKPAGVTVDDVLKRMKREKLIRTTVADERGQCWISAAPAGRRQLSAKDGLAHASDWHVDDALGLLELIYREHRPGREGFRPCVQAIGGLGDARFNALADELCASGLLQPVAEEPRRLLLTDRGAQLAEDRLRPNMPGYRFMWELPAPPIPYDRTLRLRADRGDRECTCRYGHAAWLQPNSKTKRRATIRRVGSAEWECSWCARRWLIVLIAYSSDGTPAYEDPAQATYVRPVWRPR